MPIWFLPAVSNISYNLTRGLLKEKFSCLELLIKTCILRDILERLPITSGSGKKLTLIFMIQGTVYIMRFFWLKEANLYEFAILHERIQVCLHERSFRVVRNTVSWRAWMLVPY
jgi:hypothetical protein